MDNIPTQCWLHSMFFVDYTYKCGLVHIVLLWISDINEHGNNIVTDGIITISPIRASKSKDDLQGWGF